MKILRKLLVFLCACAPMWAAASIQISSATVNSGGTSITLALTGYTGTVSCPANACTGITANLGTPQIMTSSASVSTNTIVVALGSQVQQGDVLTVTITSGSNVTDSSSDTATGQAGFAVTNNSTATGNAYTWNASGIYYVGYWSGSETGPPVTVTVPNGNGSAVNFQVVMTGTGTLDLYTYWGSGTFSIYVDGVKSTVTPNGAATFGWLTVASGIATGTHLISIAVPPYVVTAGPDAFRMTAGSLSSSISYYAPEVLLAQSADVVVDGSPQRLGSQNGYLLPLNWNTGGAGLRFRAAVTDLSFFGQWAAVSALDVFQDGVQVSSITNFGVTPGWSVIHAASGLDGTAHDYEVVLIGSNAVSGGATLVYGMFAGTGLLAPGAAEAARSAVVCYGDSICTTLVASSTLQELWFFRGIGMSSSLFGYAGEQVYNQLEESTLMTSGSGGYGIASASPIPRIVIANGGVNDQINAVSTAAYQTAEEQMLVNLVSTMGISKTNSKILVRGILPTSAANPSTYESYQAAGVAAFNATSTCATSGICAVWYSTDGWINPALDTEDGTHPNASGQAKLANREMPIAYGFTQGFSYSVTGPATGRTGTASTFTLTLPPTVTWTGDQTVSVSDGGANGTFVPFGGSSSTGSVTMTPTSGGNTFTFTYEPTVALATLTFTDGQAAWTDPAAVIYPALVPGQVLYTAISDTLSSGQPGAGPNGAINISWPGFTWDGVSIAQSPLSGYNFPFLGGVVKLQLPPTDQSGSVVTYTVVTSVGGSQVKSYWQVPTLPSSKCAASTFCTIAEVTVASP